MKGQKDSAVPERLYREGQTDRDEKVRKGKRRGWRKMCRMVEIARKDGYNVHHHSMRKTG